MRLTCPNCEAQYEVPDEVIPEAGRDVQCSNCGDTWFQNHPDFAPSEPNEPDDAQTWDAAPEPETQPEPEIEEPSEPDAPPPPPPPARQELDPSVTDVLQEEAERERAAREREADQLETQPDLGLDSRDDEVEKRNREAQARMARLRGEPEADADADDLPDIDPGTRRNLLPDIDEINSSLNSDVANSTEAADTTDVEHSLPPRKSGFRRGFMMMVLLAVIGLLLYMFAPQLAQAVPALKGTLVSYVEMVDGLRGWLDGKVMGLIGPSDGMSGEVN